MTEFYLELPEYKGGGTVESEKKRPLHIDKESLRVIIFTHHFKIIGDVFIPKSGRLTDFLNRTLGGENTDIFVPVKNAECFSISDGQLKYIADFVSLNKNQIHLILPYKNNR